MKFSVESERDSDVGRGRSNEGADEGCWLKCSVEVEELNSIEEKGLIEAEDGERPMSLEEG